MNEYYLAGLFDGEGWFSIRRAKASLYRGTREWAYQCSSHLVMRERYIIEAIQDRFGGTIRQVKKRSENHSDYWEWHLGGRDSVIFCEAMKDKLIAKARQAQLIIDFQAAKAENGNRPVPDERYAFYGECYEKMKTLNAKGVGKFEDE